MLMDLEHHISEHILQGQNIIKKNVTMDSIMKKSTDVPRDRCIMNQSRSNSSVSEGQNMVPKE